MKVRGQNGHPTFKRQAHPGSPKDVQLTWAGVSVFLYNIVLSFLPSTLGGLNVSLELCIETASFYFKYACVLQGPGERQAEEQE